MAFMEWNERYSVGHSEIDKQHKRLFELVNNVADMVKMGVTPELERILADLTSYTLDHFKYKEKIMRDSGYPDLPAHLTKHENLVKEVSALQLKLKSGERVSMMGVTRFLADWLTNHIIKEDLQYRPFLKG